MQQTICVYLESAWLILLKFDQLNSAYPNPNCIWLTQSSIMPIDVERIQSSERDAAEMKENNGSPLSLLAKLSNQHLLHVFSFLV